jgi:hypothetical protein
MVALIFWVLSVTQIFTAVHAWPGAEVTVMTIFRVPLRTRATVLVVALCTDEAVF